MNTVGKGPKHLLKHVIEINDQGQKKVLYEREQVEIALIQQNLKYYQKAMKTLVYKDKIYKRLTEDSVHDRILESKLIRDECNSDDVFNFLSILQCQNRSILHKEY